MSAASEPPATPAPRTGTLAGMYAFLRQQRPVDWLPLSFTFAGFLILMVDLLVITLIFDSHIPPSLFPVFRAVLGGRIPLLPRGWSAATATLPTVVGACAAGHRLCRRHYLCHCHDSLADSL